MPLTARQKKFIQEYLVDRNGTKAAIRAGYSKNEKAAGVHAARLLANVRVRPLIDAEIAKQDAETSKRAEKFVVTKERWLLELFRLAFTRQEDFQYLENGVVKYKDTKDWPEGAGAAIKSITQSTSQHGGSTKIELHPKNHALELLAKHYGWVFDQMKLSGAIETSAGVDHEELKKIFADPEAQKHTRALAILLAKGEKKKDE